MLTQSITYTRKNTKTVVMSIVYHLDGVCVETDNSCTLRYDATSYDRKIANGTQTRKAPLKAYVRFAPAMIEIDQPEMV